RSRRRGACDSRSGSPAVSLLEIPGTALPAVLRVGDSGGACPGPDPRAGLAFADAAYRRPIASGTSRCGGNPDILEGSRVRCSARDTAVVRNYSVAATKIRKTSRDPDDRLVPGSGGGT